MQPLTQKFFEAWQGYCAEGRNPRISDIPVDWFQVFEGHELSFGHSPDGLMLERMGDRLVGRLQFPSEGAAAFGSHPAPIRPIQRDLFNPVLSGHFGFRRVSRFWLGNRFQDAEWILMPVDREDGTVMVIGGIALFGPYEDADVFDFSDPNFERVLVQDYLPLHGFGGSPKLRPRTWTFLQAMKARVCRGGTAISGEGGIVGEAGFMAQGARRPSVMLIGNFRPDDPVMCKLAKNFRLVFVATPEEAERSIARDRFDYLVTTEQIGAQCGTSLVRSLSGSAKTVSGGLVILDPLPTALDRVLDDGPPFIQGLVAPVGEFTLRRGFDELRARQVSTV